MTPKTSLIVAVLLTAATSSAVARTSLTEMDAKLDQINAKVDTVQATLDAHPERRFVKNVGFVLDGNNSQFQMRVSCDAAFRVESFIITARDATAAVDVTYTRASILANPFGPDLTPPSGWNVGHTDYPTTVGANSNGHELLSNMGIPQLGVVDATFDIFGTRNPNTGATTLTIGATVETSADPANTCRITVVDF